MFLAWKVLVIEPGVRLLLNFIAAISTKANPEATQNLRQVNFVGLYVTITAIFDQINTVVLLRRVIYLYLATFTRPIVFLYL